MDGRAGREPRFDSCHPLQPIQCSIAGTRLESFRNLCFELLAEIETEQTSGG
jgi:hypothetical protein